MLNLPLNLEKKLNQRQASKTLRSLSQPKQDGIDFLSNDYLGIARELNRLEQTTPISGGAGGSRLLSGNTPNHEELENDLAVFYKGEVALLFPSGYMANLGLLSCIPQRGDIVYYDEHIHASLRDALRLSNAKSIKFKHNSLSDLRLKLKYRNSATNCFILLESVYSMDGDFSDVEGFNALGSDFNAYLILDEAHGTGILGKNKLGVFEDKPLSQLLARVHTFGKALGSHGAVVVSTSKLRDFLINYSRPFIYTTAMPVSQLEEIKAAHHIFKSKQKNSQLDKIIRFFNSEVEAYSLRNSIPKRMGPIQLFFGTIPDLKQKAICAEKAGIAIKPIFAPTVPHGKERIRIVLHSYNTKEEVSSLLKLLHEK